MSTPESGLHVVDESRWKTAQAFELHFAQEYVHRGDDDNLWWYEAFDRYEVLRRRTLPYVIEVGCGPHTNLRLLLPLIKFQRLWLEDPLVKQYLALRRNKPVLGIFSRKLPTAVHELANRHQATVISNALEDLPLQDKSMDLCVCINVLDHVRDSRRCLTQMRRILKDEGILVIGQDLSNDEDLKLCPESWTDLGHPIKMDHHFLDTYLEDLVPLYRRILPREQGRNPKCHYGTYLLIGQQTAR